MTPRVAVVDASALIALEQIGQLELLRLLFDEVVIPAAVACEVSRSVSLPAWVRVRDAAPSGSVSAPGPPLHAGEREVIRLALELRSFRVVLDERSARQVAISLGLPFTGTVGLLLAAKRSGLLAEVKPFLDALLEAGFRVGTRVYENALREACEE